MDLKTLRHCHGIDLRNIYCGTYTDILDSRGLGKMSDGVGGHILSSSQPSPDLTTLTISEAGDVEC